MLHYVIQRFLYMIAMLAAISVVVFIIVQLPPGDYVTTFIRRIEATGSLVDQQTADALRREFGLDKPLMMRYFHWIGNVLRGNFGRSFSHQRKPVIELISERLPLTIAISLLTILFTYALAIPIGIYSATHQYSMGDYTFTIIGYAGLATPNFLFALILMFFIFEWFGASVGGLFSTEFQGASLSLAKIWDLLKHLPVPIIVIGTAGTAYLVRVMRGCLLDELQKQYVITARAKGLAQRTLLFKYPVRVAINPIISTVGWLLPSIISGATITAIVLSLPTTGPLLLDSLMIQDMYLAGGILLFLTMLTLIGTLISDLLLVWVDPRIRFEKRARK